MAAPYEMRINGDLINLFQNSASSKTKNMTQIDNYTQL